MKAERAQAPVRQSAIFAAYYAVLVVFLLASFFPQYRLWGVNWWAYFPGYVPFVLFAIGAVAPIIMRLVLRRGELDVDENQVSADGSNRYFIIVFCMTVLCGLAFYLLRARTHFLGDGYAALSSLASDNPLVKPRGLGEGLLHVWLKSIIGGDSETAALLSFQVISISAGVLFLVAVAMVSKRLFERTIDRMLFWLGLASGGYMLLFFGYVENYSLFVLSVGVYSLMGLLVVKGKINRWLILPMLGLAVFFHIMGVTLIPSAIYLLVTNSKLSNALARLNWKTKLLMGTVTIVILVSIFYYFYSTDYFFRFAFVPLFENRFTVEEYTLFSSKHLLDYFNLLILLLPGLPLVVATLLFLPLRKIFKQRVYRYLLILLVSTLGAVFIFDPKLGMPRDWDLFSLSGASVALFSYYLLLNIRSKGRRYAKIALLSVFLSFLSLFPRAGSQTVEDISVAHFKNYISLDKAKCRTGRLVLGDYYEKLGEHDKVLHIKQQWGSELLENDMLVEVDALMEQNKLQPAISLLNRLIELNPGIAGAWADLGQCYYILGKYDSALTFLNIADGLNPYNPTVLNNLGTMYLRKGEFRRAEKVLTQSIKYDPGFDKPLYSLAILYVYYGDIDKSFTYFEKLELIEVVPVDYFRTLGDNYRDKGCFDKAARAYQCALHRGLDSTYVKKLIEKYPQLKE